ncbi:MAG: hypothetical protein ACP5E5_07635 [Acidobacteriaceae bacterium]
MFGIDRVSDRNVGDRPGVGRRSEWKASQRRGDNGTGRESGVSCTSSTVVGPTGLTEPPSGLTAPRNFHANLLVLSMHYEF